MRTDANTFTNHRGNDVRKPSKKVVQNASTVHVKTGLREQSPDIRIDSVGSIELPDRRNMLEVAVMMTLMNRCRNSCFTTADGAIHLSTLDTNGRRQFTAASCVPCVFFSHVNAIYGRRRRKLPHHHTKKMSALSLPNDYLYRDNHPPRRRVLSYIRRLGLETSAF